MSKCTVYFEEGISRSEIDQLIQAMDLLKGVAQVEFDKPGTPIRQKVTTSTVLSEESILTSSPTPEIFPDPTKQFIDEVIRWAVKENKLSLAEVKKQSPDTIMDQAMSLFDKMPEEPKKQIGVSFQRATE